MLEQDITLIESLRFIVPEWIIEFATRGYSNEWLVGEGKRCAAAVGTYGDVLQFADRAEPSTRQRNSRTLAFNSLARGLAAICLVEGRADYHGLHWCSQLHEDCPIIRHSRLPVTEQEVKEVIALLDEFEEMLDRGRRRPRS